MVKKTSSNNTAWLVSILAVIAFAGAIGGYMVYDYNQERLAEQQREEAQKNSDEQAAMKALYALYIDSFKSDLKRAALEYKESRKILSDISNPLNFETLEDAKANYEIFSQDIAPALRKRSQNLVDVFERYIMAMREDAAHKKNSIEDVFFTEWEAMSKEQLGHTVTFLSYEEDILQTYEELMKFYYTHAKRYRVDEQTGEFVFNNEDDLKTHDDLKMRIRALRARQIEARKAQD